MRIIDADELLKQYDKEHEGPPGRARELIENAHTVKDAVKVIRWKDCRYYIYSRVLDTKVCENILGMNCCTVKDNDYCSAAARRRNDIDTPMQLPSVQPECESGEWIRNDNGTYSCSVCQSWIPEEQHYYARYCLYCGAKMRSEDNG